MHTLDAGVQVTSCQWNHDGTILAVAGRMELSGAVEKVKEDILC